jgi:hypothetical protein
MIMKDRKIYKNTATSGFGLPIAAVQRVMEQTLTAPPVDPNRLSLSRVTRLGQTQSLALSCRLRRP